jgi:HlyD family secretion protein
MTTTRTTPAPGHAARAFTKPRRRSLERWIKRAFGVLVLVGLAALIVVALLPKPVAVDVAPATQGPMRVTVDEDGTTRVKDRYVVSAPLRGSLQRLELRPGDAVKLGGTLARMVPMAPALLDERTRGSAEARVAGALAAQRQARALADRARAHQDFVKKDTERQRTLFDKGVTTREALDQAELSERTASADVDSAKFGTQVADYEVQMARAALGRLSKQAKPGGEEQMLVTSPVDGRVLKVLHQSEGAVQAGTPLVEVGDPKALEIVVDVLTSDAVNVRSGAEASIVEWGGAPLQAWVRTVEPSAFTRISALGVEEQRVNVLLDPSGPAAAWAPLGDGYRVKAQIVTNQKSGALQVPSSAVFRHDAGWAVFRAVDAVARLTPVELGLRTQRDVEVVGGLGAGERVVLHPSDRIRDGVKLQIR